MARYAIHGLTIASDRRLDLPTSTSSRPTDIEVSYVAQLPEAGDKLYEVGRADGPELVLFAVHGGDDALTLKFPEGVAYRVAGGGRRIACAGDFPHHALASVLTEIVIPRVLQLHGLLCLHASAVGIGDRALALTAPSGTGKSTLIAALCARGHALICDDSLALSAAGEAFPGPATVRLWEDSAANLLGDGSDVQRARGGKLQVGRPGVSGAMALGALCHLEKADHLAMERLSVSDAVATLTQSLHRIETRKREVLADEFEALARVAERVAVWRVRVPHDFARLPEVCDELERLLVDLDESAST